MFADTFFLMCAVLPKTILYKKREKTAFLNQAKQNPLYVLKRLHVNI